MMNRLIRHINSYYYKTIINIIITRPLEGKHLCRPQCNYTQCRTLTHNKSVASHALLIRRSQINFSLPPLAALPALPPWVPAFPLHPPLPHSCHPPYSWHSLHLSFKALAPLSCCHIDLQANRHQHAEIKGKDSDVICWQPGSTYPTNTPPLTHNHPELPNAHLH